MEEDFVKKQSKSGPINDEMFRHFFEKSVVAMSITSCSGQVYVNQAFSSMLGYTREELNQLKWQDITYPEDISVSQKAIQDLMDCRMTEAHFQKRYLKKNGQILVAQVHTSMIRTEDECNFFLTSIIDITDSLEAKSETLSTNHRYQRFINSSEDLIFLKDEHFRHILVNQSLADFYGQSQSELIGKTDFDLMNLNEAEMCRKTDLAALESPTPITSTEFVGNRVFESTKFVVEMMNGSSGVGGYIRDITQSYHQKRQLEQNNLVYQTISNCLIRSYIDKFEYLDYALHEGLNITQSKYGYIYYYDEDKKEFSLNTWTNGVMNDCAVVEKQTKYLLEKTGIWGEVVRQRKPIVVNDFAASNPLKKGYPEGHVSLTRFCTVPVMDNHRIVAVVGMGNKESDYTDYDVNALSILMNAIWNTIEKREKDRQNGILLQQLSSMFDNHKAVMLLIEPENGKILDCNPSATDFYGYSKAELTQLTISDLNELPEAKLKEMRRNLLGQQMHRVTMTHILKNREKRIVDVYATVVPYQDQQAIYGIIVDVTDREEANRRITHISYHDYLTDIYNRRFFEEEYDRLNREEVFPLSIIMGDVNGLKLVNDSLGHTEGDLLLVEAAKLLVSHCDEECVVARVGGDEFAILMKRKTEDQVSSLMSALEEHNKTLLKTSTSTKMLSIAYGYAIQKHPGEPLQALMKEAEKYLYASKYYDDSSAKGRTVSIVMNTLFEKSAREQNHSQRVGHLCQAFAEVLAMNSTEVNMIRTAGFLHDIGKIGIPEGILNKKGKLTSDEWSMMKTHVERSYRILKNSSEFADISEIVRGHHEKWDGTGYPLGLSGEQIPLASRIIAFADAFDAMTNVRSYRSTLTKESAIHEIRRCSGTQFDPNMTEIFISMIQHDEW